jgi:hypothetical protein
VTGRYDYDFCYPQPDTRSNIAPRIIPTSSTEYSSASTAIPEEEEYHSNGYEQNYQAPSARDQNYADGSNSNYDEGATESFGDRDPLNDEEEYHSNGYEQNYQAPSARDQNYADGSNLNYDEGATESFGDRDSLNEEDEDSDDNGQPRREHITDRPEPKPRPQPGPVRVKWTLP